MEEIKFRVILPTSNIVLMNESEKFITPEDTYYFTLKEMLTQYSPYHPALKYIAEGGRPDRCINIFDTNAKEIYEGDIIDNGAMTKAIVCIGNYYKRIFGPDRNQDTRYGIYFKPLNFVDYNIFDLTECLFMDFDSEPFKRLLVKVIGNIHQNEFKEKVLMNEGLNIEIQSMRHILGELEKRVRA